MTKYDCSPYIVSLTAVEHSSHLSSILPVVPAEYFLHSANSHQEALEQTLVALQMDLDKDVKYFASVHPGSTRLSEDAMSTTSSTY